MLILANDLCSQVCLAGKYLSYVISITLDMCLSSLCGSLQQYFAGNMPMRSDLPFSPFLLLITGDYNSINFTPHEHLHLPYILCT